MELRSAMLAAAGVLALTACADNSPTAVVPHRPALDVAAASDAPTDRHIVLLKSSGKVSADFARSVAAQGGRVEKTFEAVGIAFVTGLSDAAATQLAQRTDVQSVDRDFAYDVDAGTQRVNADVGDAGVAADATLASGLVVPTGSNPAFYGRRQWNYLAIGADKAWAAGKKGSSSVKVAILDSGIDYTFPDLAPLIDDAHSAAFDLRDTTVRKTFYADRADLRPYVDFNGHGTHVASIVASKGTWVSGVTSETRLMAIKVGSVTGSISGSALVEGILYAIDNGADVINMSLGGPFVRAGGGGVGSINRLFNYANRKGVTVVVSAGNDAADMQHSGSAYYGYCDAPNVICVSATGPVDGGNGQFLNVPTDFAGPFSPLDEPAQYTNYGTNSINVAAPGGNFALNAAGTELTTAGWIWQACSKFTMVVVTDAKTKVKSAAGKGTCAQFPQLNLPAGIVGTSQAAPHVSGLAALLVEKYGRNPGQIRTAIQQSADDLGAVGVDPYYGKGRINVARALGL